jgi:two-component system sensor histidine kinase YesM
MYKRYKKKIKNYFANLSIKKKLSVLMIVTIFLAISIIGLTTYKTSEDITRESAIKAYSTLLQSSNNVLETNLVNLEGISANLMSNFNVQSIVRGELSVNMRLKQRGDIYSTLNGYMMNNSYIDSIAILSFCDSISLFCPAQEKNREQGDFNTFVDTLTDDAIEKLGDKSNWIALNDDTEVVSLIRVINIYGIREKKGILCINVSRSIFDNVSKALNLSPNSGYIIKDKNNTLLYGHFEAKSKMSDFFNDSRYNENNVYKQIDEKDYFLITDNFSMPNWIINVYVPLEEIFESGNIIKVTIIMTIIIALIFTIILVLLISDFITKPIKKLGNIMKEVEKGDLTKRFDSKYEDEIGFLGKNFNSMIKRLNNDIIEIKRNSQIIRRSELEALQMNINPHFLYNNLNTINWMAQDIHAENIEVFSRALTNYFRLSLSKGSNIIPINEELEHLKNYLIIQKIRYEDSIEFIFEIDERIKQNLIVKLSLQPLVENSIFHGIEGKEGFGKIIIQGYCSGNSIIFEVIDNGMGMTEEKLKEIRTSLSIEETRGYGLRNVNQRIKLYFGEKYGLEIQSQYEKGTVVRLTIPIKEERDLNYESIDS